MKANLWGQNVDKTCCSIWKRVEVGIYICLGITTPHSECEWPYTPPKIQNQNANVMMGKIIWKDPILSKSPFKIFIFWSASVQDSSRSGPLRAWKATRWLSHGAITTWSWRGCAESVHEPVMGCDVNATVLKDKTLSWSFCILWLWKIGGIRLQENWILCSV